ncbi:MAG: hypothetical protein HC910_19885 [Spirulinaceae cyanobacterium SM2_1_0]|nr:hypothetical protein [Spirulinaceae cyanobacterium SM2_1_0]
MLYLSWRAVLIRSLAAAAVNGVVTLWLLLIAPLGLAAVIFNTAAVAISTFVVCLAGDLVVGWLLRGQGAPESLRSGAGSRLERRDRAPDDISHRERY